MQLISGQASRIRLSVPRGMIVRPTAAVSRKALFDSIRDFAGFTVVDLFAGSGALGLEAASRGASRVFFIEQSSEICSVISENIRKVVKTGVTAEMNVYCNDSISAHKILPLLRKSVDIIFADPPYSESEGVMSKIFKDANFADWAGNAVLVWELPDQAFHKLDLNQILSNSVWKLSKKRQLGRTEFAFFKVRNKGI